MTIYITQGRFTGEFVEGVLDKPEDRAPAVAALLEAAGGKLLNYYITFGDYDFLLVSEGDNERDVLSALLTVAASGSVTDLRTVPAVTSADAKGAYEKAKSIRASYRRAGAG